MVALRFLKKVRILRGFVNHCSSGILLATHIVMFVTPALVFTKSQAIPLFDSAINKFDLIVCAFLP